MNTALAQVLSQKQHTVNGNTTYFLPGSGAQQTQGAWTYLHTDALGSIRHMANPVGQVVGGMRYSPFGEIIEQTGVVSPRGYTGEFQNPMNNLIYLRARYYDPKLGRFLTQDSLIPDLLNGQAWNAYAYVYNDTINLVDPSGHSSLGLAGFGGPYNVMVGPDYHRTSLRDTAREGAQGVLNFLDWWNETPSGCSCQGESSQLLGGAAIGPQAAWAYISEPAERYGTKITETLVSKQVLKWQLSPPLIRNLKGDFGYKTVQVWQESHRSSGPLNQLVRPGQPRRNGLHYESATSRYRLDTKFRPKFGPKGAGGTIALAGIIDGIFQFAPDAANSCLAWGQRFNRAGTAALFGMVAGAAVFAAAVAATAPAWVAIGVSLGVGILAGKLLEPYKTDLFANNPKYFGG